MQTMNSWTPGPWHVGVKEYVFEDDEAWSIGHESAFDVGAAMKEADARLIAAAPEMAELLAETLADFDQESTGVQVSGGNAPQIRALLARIRGA